MLTLLIAVGAFVGYLVAYHTYGRWLSRKIFKLDADAVVPSHELRDDVDFVPTKKEVIFGHHFTSIAGTGPIVGPAIAVFWGWLPALVWVLVGSIFFGAVHDFGALVVSLRNRGQTVGEVAGRLINKRARLLFLLILFFALTIVLAIFGLVIASIFKSYPESVLSVWIEIPIAVAIGFWVYRKRGGLLLPSLVALALLYAGIYVGVYHFQFTFAAVGLDVSNPIITWTVILMGYCFVASVLPVWTLLQPRDYINSHQLMVALGLLGLGLVVASATGQVDLVASAPAVADTAPAGAPPIWPFLFITIACGAISGFHCLVSSGTSSKQLTCETDAQFVGYGSMLLEGALAVIVILACCAGVGMGVENGGDRLTGLAAWQTKYDASGDWSKFGLSQKVGAFVDGGANFVSSLGIARELAVGIIAVLVASFAATTLDTATRLQRYVIQELGSTLRIAPLTNKYTATAVAVVLGAAMATIPAPGKPMGTGGLILWPLFGATNQLLAGLALMVIVFYLWRRNINIWFALIPMVIMLAMPAWALCWQLFNSGTGWALPVLAMAAGREPWAWSNTHLLFTIGLATLGLQVWMVIEGLLLWPRARGVLEETLPALATNHDTIAAK
ncbi:MAG TPA: carbon starvation protein A [Planctomycetaceae bacterium]|jgi:carbon starvation protein|nr:carbon starvation protein A [Planctomycetaceae bacterium]|tara:strand:+ start:2150 stop:3997 length:1848 start_codon:yes stop_codon:yes gene_type:complete